MNRVLQDRAYFISFCIEQYKVSKGFRGEEVMRLFAEHKVLGYLNDHYEVLHTQGHRWLIQDIDAFIAREKEASND